MSQSESQSGRYPELFEIFYEQFELIKIKRTVQIELSEFPSDISLGTICEALSELLALFNPPVHLERIILSGNALMSLPPEFELLCGEHMRYLDLHNNHFSVVPEVIGNCCPHLEGLDLSQNSLNSLPRSVLSNLPDLKVLLLKNNEFNYLPPVLGEMINLETIGISENPLVLPSLDLVKSMPGGTNDLKAYLLSNSDTLEQCLQNQVHQNQKAPTTPSINRTQSLTDTKSKSLKASKRMGFIINSTKTTPEDVTRSQLGQNNLQDMITPSKPERKLLLTDTAGMSTFPERKDSAANIDPASVPSTPSTYTTTTASVSRSSSPPSFTTGSTHSRPGSRNRSRANTLREISPSVDYSELTDSEQKSGSYFRRLSTLQERPADETFKSSQEELSSSFPLKEESLKKPHFNAVLDASPLKHASRKASIGNNSGTDIKFGQHPSSAHLDSHYSYDTATALKIARKVLLSFSDVHSSIKRLTMKSSDKEVTVKVVPLLHRAKVNVDLLVETIESADDNGENHKNLIVSAVIACVSSFRQVLELFVDTLSSFSAKIDVFFIRMVYLTLYGSLNEMQNVYRLLNPVAASFRAPSLARSQFVIGLDPKLKQSHSGMTPEDTQIPALDPSNTALESGAVTIDEADEKLYQCIDLAIANAKTVYSELTNAISKSAIASANANGSPAINLVVSTKFKDLTNACVAFIDITNKLATKLATIRSNQSQQAKKLLRDDITQFLTLTLQTFASAKGIMDDVPILNEVKRSMATLTKTTKDLTVLVEASSYHSISESLASIVQPQTSLGSVLLPLAGPPPLSSIHSTSALNLPLLQGGVALVRTPLVATVGAAAAQAILPPADPGHVIMSSTSSNPPLSFNIPPLVSSDVLNTGLHTAPVQSMEQYYAKNVNPFDKI